MKLTKKAKLNFRALGLSVYIYILLLMVLGLFGVFIEGKNVIIFIVEFFKSIINISVYLWYIYIPLQFILYLISQVILRKYKVTGVKRSIYISLGVIIFILILFIVFPPEGARLIG